jgi:CubicO group peptidase (beta-lactamase class C family)
MTRTLSQLALIPLLAALAVAACMPQPAHSQQPAPAPHPAVAVVNAPVAVLAAHAVGACLLPPATGAERDIVADRSRCAGDPPAVQRADELVRAMQGGSPADRAAFVQQAYAPEFLQGRSPEAHLNLLAQLFDGTGDFTVHSVVASGASEATVVHMAELTRQWRQLVVHVEAEPPHRITRLQPPQHIPPPPGHEPEPRLLSTQQATVELHEYASRLAEAGIFSGGVLVARGDSVLFHSAYGAASREFGVANTPDTRFIIGSVNKMFTAVGILQMLEQGRLTLQDPVQQHLPGVLPEDIARQVRIEQLLTHTSGLGDFLFVPEMWRLARPNFRTIEDYLPRLANVELSFEPGAGWQYSNASFLILGAILEKVSGMPYDDYIARHIFEPAGMTSTGAPDLDLVPTGLASTYQREFSNGEGRFRSDRYTQPVRGTPAGGGFSTTADLHRFMQALRSHTLLSPETTRLMQTSKPELEGSNSGFGFGMQIFGQGGSRVGHTGGGPGTAAIVELDMENDLVTVVLGNQNTGSNFVWLRARQLFGAGNPSLSW